MIVPAERTAELYDLITEGRDEVKRRLAMNGCPAVKTAIALQVNGANDRLYDFPGATKDPLLVLEVRELSTREPLEPAVSLDFDGGHYRWENFRQLRIAGDLSPAGGIEIDAVLADVDITAATTEANVGLPTPCHRAIGKYAAWLAVTADEESDGAGLERQFEKAMQQLETLYGEFDRSAGLSLRHGIMRSAGRAFGDMLTD